MKYIVILGDGMAGEPLAQLDGRTTLEAAATPNMDALASCGVMGLAKMVPNGMKPGSDVANLAVMGYDPKACYSGRSPLEALSLRIDMEPTDIIFRCNLVTLSEDGAYEDKTILDHSAGEISSADADILMDAIREAFNSDTIRFFSGTSYRHITIWKEGELLDFEAPHDHLGQTVGQYLPKHPLFRQMMERSFQILNDHPLNRARAAAGKNKANSLWFWGAGTNPSLGDFTATTGLKGAMISAVDLLKGIAVGAGMQVCQVEGATGSIDTNFEGKAQAAIDALLKDGCDFAYIHVEAPDEMGHQGKIAEKVKSIEYLDTRLIALVKKAMEEAGEDFRMLILPDHPTPIRIRTHNGDPVPYLLYDSTRQLRKKERFTEENARFANNFEPHGHRLLEKLIGAK